MNVVFIGIILIAFLSGMIQQIRTPSADIMQKITESLLHSANEAVTIAIGLIGVLALFLGLVKILEQGGLLESMSKLIYPLMRFLFPEIPPNHPAISAMTLNFSANMLGLGNAATPFGIKAMQALNTLNPQPGTATNAMVLFLAINTSCLTLIPTKVIALRAEAHSVDPSGIITTTLFATLCSTLVAILAAKLFQRMFNHDNHQNITKTNSKININFRAIIFIVCFLSLIPLMLVWGAQFSAWIVPSLVVLTVLYGAIKKINVYTSFVEGAKEGFGIAVNIIPYLVAILAAISMLRASGVLGAMTQTLGKITEPLGLPADAIPMIFMRPLSGSGSFGLLTDIFHNPALGPDSYVGYLVSTMMGSTETTFYVLAVYFGAIQIKRMRHAIPAALCADAAGMIASIIAVKFWLS